MVTVIDMTSGKLIYQSRSADPMPMTDSGNPSVDPQTALQTLPIESAKPIPGTMPPEFAQVCVDELLERWQQ